jgi:DNA-binding response OmpR family regulator
MKPEIRVLIVSRDEMLLRTRELMMGAYFHATGVGRPSEAKAQLQAMHFDLIVLCHSLRCDEGKVLADIAHRQQPPGKVLALGARTENSEQKSWADDQIGVDAGPFGLLVKSASMVNFKIKSKAKTSGQHA